VDVRICEPQCITSLSGCLRVQFRMSTAPVYGCHISILLCIYVCKNITSVNFQEIKDILLLLFLLLFLLRLSVNIVYSCLFLLIFDFLLVPGN